MSDRIASMYGPTALDITDIIPTRIPLIVEPSDLFIELQKNIAIIRDGDKTVAVPTMAHIQGLITEITMLQRQLKHISAENRRMRIFMNTMSKSLSKAHNSLDNKMDKF